MADEKITRETISFSWYDHCTGKEQCYNIERELDGYEAIDTPVFANDSFNGHEHKDTVILADGVSYKRKITAELQDGFQVGTVFWAKGAEASKYYISNYVKKGVNGGIVYMFRRLDHSDPVDFDVENFKEGKILLVRGFVHEKKEEN